MHFTVRPATAADVPAVLPMVQAVCDVHRALEPARYDFLPDITARYASWLPKRAVDPRSVFLVAEADSRLTGFLVGEVLDEIPIFTLKQYGFIHDLWVDPTARKQGAGRALIEEAVNRFAAMGITQVRGDTAATNENARSLLNTLGFAPTTIQVLKTVAPTTPDP